MKQAIKSDNFAEKYIELDLRFQELLNIEFDECTFVKCDFSNTKFKNCIFHSCTFLQCDLSLVNVVYSKFLEIAFIDCKVIGIDWTKASWNSLIKTPIKFESSIINSSSFYGLDLKGMILKECEAKDVDFRETDLSEADFSYSDFSDTSFLHTNLTKVNFSYAKNFNIDIQANILKGAIFSRYDAIRLLSAFEIEFVE